MEFKPPVSERETDELIAIANSTKDDWQQEIIVQSKVELNKRGISKEIQEDHLAIWRKEAEENERQYKLKLEQNTQLSYSLLKMIFIFLISPAILLGKVSMGYSYTQLKQENYLIMARQRLFLLIFGALSYLICFYIFVHYS